MRVLPLFTQTILAAQMLAAQSMLLSVQASQDGNGQNQVDRPLLVEQPTQELNNRRETYTFSIRLPDNAGDLMAGVLIEQPDRDQLLDFDLDKTEAFRGTPEQREAIDLQSVEQIQPSQIQIRFAEPVNPGTAITIALKPQHVPTGSNTYQIRVSALPVATNTAEFLGYQQVNTCRSRYDNAGDRRVLFWDLPPEFDPRVRNHPCQR